MTRYTARDLAARLVPLHAERDDWLRRGVPVPEWLTAAIHTLEAQLVNEYNAHEAALQDEVVATSAPAPFRWLWPVAIGLGVLAVVAWVGALS